MNEFRKFLLKNRTTPKWAICIPDLFICSLAYFYANYLLSEFRIIYIGYESIWQDMLTISIVPAICFFIFKTHQHIIRFLKLQEAATEISLAFPDTIRILDVLISVTGLIMLSPVFLMIGVAIKTSSKGPVIFKQLRVGKNDIDFMLYKFRTMYAQQAEKQSLTVGNRDKRITRVGYYLRKFKLDEFPQLYNVLRGEMSVVGPRPELRKFVEMYSAGQKEILLVKPGITDYASICFRNENVMLAKQENPEAYYIKEIIPVKIQLNRQYANKKTVINYLNVIIKTLYSVLM